MNREFFLSWVKQSSLRLHLSSAQQLEIGDELSRRAESVSQDLRFCVVADGDVLWRTALTTAVSARRAPRMRTGLQELSPISEKVTVAAAFRNVHDVCKVIGHFQSLRPRRWAIRIRVSQDLRFCVVVDGDVSGLVSLW